MTEQSLSHLSDEELLRLYKESVQPSESAAKEEPSFLSSALQGYGNYAKGVAKGAAQGFGDIGASIGNLGISGAEHLLGRQFPHIPHPNLLSGTPSGLAESIGQKLGGLIPGAIPGTAGIKAASLVSKAPALVKLLAGLGGGAAAGAAGNEENRGLGALTGAAEGTLGVTAPMTFNLAKSIKPKNIAQVILKNQKGLEDKFGETFENVLKQAEESGAGKFVKPQEGDIGLLKKAGDSDLVYALEKYNKEPGIKTAHDAQKDLNKYISSLMGTKKGTLESDALKEATKLKNRILEQIHSAMHKAEAPHLSEQYHNARMGYKKELGPYLNSKLIQQLEKGDIRKSKFADKLLESEAKGDQKFMAHVGENIPELKHREMWNAVKKNKLAQAGAGGIAATLLPYGLAKALGIL